MTQEVVLPRLKSEVSLVEVITAATTASLVMSVLFNWGFFYHSNATFVSLLTLQDFSINAAISMVPVLGTYALGFAASAAMSPTDSLEKDREFVVDVIRTKRLDLPPIGASKNKPKPYTRFVMWVYFGIEPRARALLALACLLALVGFLINLNWRDASNAVGITLIVYPLIFGWILLPLVGANRAVIALYLVIAAGTLAFATGTFVYWQALRDAEGNASTVTLSDASVVSGGIVRINSNYAFVITTQDLTAIPMSQVKSISANHR